MLVNNNKFIFSKKILINNFGQLRLVESFIFFFSMRFYRFIIQSR